MSTRKRRIRIAMSESEAATLNTERNCSAGEPPNLSNAVAAAATLGPPKATSVNETKSNEQLKETKKWKKTKVKNVEIVNKEVPNVVNRLAVKIELKKESDNCQEGPTLQNGSDIGLKEGVVCHLCGKNLSSPLELGLHLKNEHIISSIKQSPKINKQTNVIRQRTQYKCLSCNGKTFSSKLSLHRHAVQHVSQPRVKLTRLKDIFEERSESPVLIPSGKPQVALKRVTASCHSRSPLKFRLKFTGDQDGKDSFKLVKAETQSTGNSEETLVDNKSGSELVKELAELNSDELSKVHSNEIQNTNATFSINNQDQSYNEEDIRLTLDDSNDSVNAESVPAMVEVSQEQHTVPSEEECTAGHTKNTESGEKSGDSHSVISLIEDRIMRQMKNGRTEMDKIQSSSPTVQGSNDPLQVEKNSLNNTAIDSGESLQPEFIPIEGLDKETAAQFIESSSRETSLNDAPQERLSEASDTHILCEACGESILGDQTALEDHCLCRGHYKCAICSVACASTDALAVHAKESHPNPEIAMQPVERKKKSGLRALRRKHQQDSAEKEQSRDSLSDRSNSPKLNSPSVESPHSKTPPQTTMPNAVPADSASSSISNIRVSEGSQLPGRMQEGRSSEVPARKSPSSQSSNNNPPALSQAPVNYPPRSSQHPNAHMRPPHSRISESMPPPLMRPPNARNSDSQSSRGNLSNIRMNEPMQPPPALYKMPTTSHVMNNSQMGPSVSTVSNPGYPRGIPASGYQSDPPMNHATNHLSAAAAMTARYQPMHPGYPPVSQPPSSYPPYPQSVQMQQAQLMQQQRYGLGPPPPYPNQMHHLQQGPRPGVMPQDAYGLASSQQAYGQSLLKAHLEQARMQLPQPSTLLQSMQNLQQEHYQQQQLQQQLFQQPQHHQLMQPQQQQEQNHVPPPPPPQGQKRKSSSGNHSGLRYHHQNALNSQQSQMQQNTSTVAKQRRTNRDNIGIPSKQTDSDCEIIAVQQRGEGVPVIQSIQGSNSSGSSGSNGESSSSPATSQSSPESTIHLTDSITLSVRQPPGSTTSAASSHRGHNASAVASILATRGITVTPASGSVQHPRTGSGQHRSRPSPPLTQSQAASPPQPSTSQHSPPINSAISISQSSRQANQAQHSSDGFAVPAPVGPSQRVPQRQQASADRPPRPPTVDLTDENAAAAQSASVCQCRLCDKQFPSMESLQNHMQLIHQTRNYFRCTICNTKHPSQQALTNHVKRVHKFGGNSPMSDLVIPLVDLRNAVSMNRLNNLGVKHVISLSQLGMSSDSASFCIPIMSLDPSGPNRTNSISGLMAMGTTAVLPIGPVKSLPGAHQTPQTSPQTVPSSSHANVPPPPPLAPLRAPPPTHQYTQPSHQMPPR